MRKTGFQTLLGPSLSRCVVVASLVAPACGVLSPEEQLLTRFFEAARLHDTTVVASLSAVTFNPRTEGIVRDFEILDVQRNGGAEQVTLNATVATPEGTLVERMLRVTLQQRDGRWFITGMESAGPRPGR